MNSDKTLSLAPEDVLRAMPLTYAAREAFKAVEQKQLVYVASLSQPGNLAEQRINRLVRQSMNHGASVLIRFKIEKWEFRNLS